MASFVVKHAVKHIAERTTDIISGVGHLVLDGAHNKHKDERDSDVPTSLLMLLDHQYLQHYDSDGDKDVVEVEGFDKEGHHKHLADIQPYLNLAIGAYKDEFMDTQFPEIVKHSSLVCNLESPTKLRIGKFTTDTEVHVCVLHDGTLVFAFRGTEINWRDWKSMFSDLLTDLKQNQVPLEHYNASEMVAYTAPSSVKVHEGFMLAFQSVTRTARSKENLCLVAERLGVKAAEVKKVVCTGHSLGGALATLCAHWCRNVAYRDAEIWCVTIGSPRVGNVAFAKDFNKIVHHSHRVVNKGDVVPSLPHLYTYPKCWTAYKHVRGLIYLSEHPTSKDTILLKRGGRRPSLIMLNSLDHSCKAYQDSINKLLLNSLSKYGSPRITLPDSNHH